MLRLVAGLLAVAVTASSADLSASLLAAASYGKTADVKALLDKGANAEARDKKGRTPLMLAAQYGHPDTIRLLLAQGAKAEDRDQLGYTAYGLTVFAPAGHGDHQEALKALPAPARMRLAVTTEVSLARVQSSCFMSRGELPGEIGHLHLDTALREEFLAASGKGLVEIVSETPDATATFTVIPSVSCSGAGGDSLSMEMNVRVVRSRDQQVLLEKVFGGGIKGLRSQNVNNPAQYGPVLLAWIRPQAAPIYWAVAESLYRSVL